MKPYLTIALMMIGLSVSGQILNTKGKKWVAIDGYYTLVDNNWTPPSFSRLGDPFAFYQDRGELVLKVTPDSLLHVVDSLKAGKMLLEIYSKQRNREKELMEENERLLNALKEIRYLLQLSKELNKTP